MGTQAAIAPATVCNYLHKELKHFTQKLHMPPIYLKLLSQADFNSQDIATESSEIILCTCFELFSPMIAFSVPGRVNKQNCRIRGLKGPRKHFKPEETLQRLWLGALCSRIK